MGRAGGWQHCVAGLPLSFWGSGRQPPCPPPKQPGAAQRLGGGQPWRANSPAHPPPRLLKIRVNRKTVGVAFLCPLPQPTLEPPACHSQVGSCAGDQGDAACLQLGAREAGLSGGRRHPSRIRRAAPEAVGAASGAAWGCLQPSAIPLWPQKWRAKPSVPGAPHPCSVLHPGLRAGFHPCSSRLP